MEPTTIQAGQLLLRPWRDTDAPAVERICQDPEIQRWTRVPVPYTAADARSFVGEISAASWAAGRPSFAVVDAASEQVLASIALGIDAAEAVGEVGFWAAPEARDRGVMTEALRALCRYAFAELGLARVQWTAYVGNVGSRRVAEKAGFTIEGTLRSAANSRGRRVDMWIGGLLPGDLSDPGVEKG